MPENRHLLQDIIQSFTCHSLESHRNRHMLSGNSTEPTMQNILGHEKQNPTPYLSRLFIFLVVVGVLLSQVSIQPARAAGTDLNLTKTVEGGITTAQVGDVIRYRIHFACSNLITPCGPMEITDVLQPGLIYQPPPASSVPAGFSISYDAPTRTITITKDDNNLLDGSQYDAVIAVTVDYDLRPLPATINNTVNGRIAPTGPGNWESATPASAPPIRIGTVTSSWDLTKSLSSPTINPTVNTDVTYRLRLCPTTPPAGQGNVPLRNVTFTDTLPAGATFVSASDGGTESGGIVTWPAYAGPVVPPNCLTRYVTIRYDSPPFQIGDRVINTASVDGEYTDSSGATIGPGIGLGSDPLDHPIDPVYETPNYSKDDAGDPIGLTGTGRFILNLNTIGTNYPSNQLILVDNLPPQLQVTTITSGQWAPSFDFVRAYVEYSTNNGSSYTAFPNQPVSYNSNATYTAPAANMTNIRWRFEYDPDATEPYTFTQAGLPYTWSFTSSPQIRVIPRAAATVADPPSNAAMPEAVSGNTYNNCLQVNRINSLGNAITDPCNTEPLTVNGTYVSLRTSKSETPGEMWDDLGDPNIDDFVPDGSILPGDTLRYTITVEVTERSSAPLINPTIQDTLPAASDFVFVRNGIAQLDGVNLPANQQPAFSRAGQVLTWAWNNPSPALTITPLTLGSHFLTLEFYARIPRGQAPNTYTNNLYTVTDSVDAVCENGTQVQDSANGDVDGDGDPTDPACRVPDTYVVERSAALRGEKWIRSTDPGNSQVVLATTFLPDGACPNGGMDGLSGGGTNPFTRYPCISQAFREGALSAGQYVPPPANDAMDDFEYNLRIFNDGNVPMLSYVLYDILPYVGDTGSGGVLSSSARLSEFQPTLRGPVEFIGGPGLTGDDFTIEYNETTNPCRPEVFDQPAGSPVPAGCDDNWSPDWSTSARSYRIRLKSGSLIQPAATTSEVRFGVRMYIPADADPPGEDANDALPHEIAWNSFAHVGAYDSDPGLGVVVQDLLASEPRKVGITVPEQMSVGNRVWRDADNSGTINPPDDASPGIPGVTVNLYRDTDNNGLPDGAAIGTTVTDTNGYYLFSNITFDMVTLNNNRYVIGIPSSNFAAGQPLESLRSSTGIPANSIYTAPPLNTTDSADDGIDPVTPGQEVLSPSFLLQPGTEPTSEADLSSNDRDGLPGERRGVNSELDDGSDLTIDFGFFGGTDIPFSLGNHVWYDNGQTAPGVYNYAQRNDGIRQATEPPVVGAIVRLYRDGNANGIPEAAEMIRTDLTDANGFYLFDNLDPGPYYVEIPAVNFANGHPLAGWYSSQPTGTETTGVNGGSTTADIDNDDNGINNDFPETKGIFSGVIQLTRGVPEPLGETFLSNEPDPGLPANQGYSPTGWDGPASIGRFGETDATSNLTVDFGFIPPMSMGNRLWIDEGAGTTPFRTGYNNGSMDGTEVGIGGVTVQLWRDTDGTAGLQVTGGDTLMYTTTTDAAGYYLFDRLQPGNNYYVHIPASNFSGGVLANYRSSNDASQSTPPADDLEDNDDDGIDSATPATTGITSPQITMSYNGESTSESDINNSGAYGPQNRGNFGQADSDSNLTVDFGFVHPPRSLGNRLWIDTNNNGQVTAGEPAVPAGVRVSLYLDTNADNQPDDLGVLGDRTDDWIADDLTDANGYYLFDNLPPNIYIVGVDRVNFAAGGLLEGYNSSTGNVDNASNNTDSRDNGVDRLNRADPVASPHGILSTRINLTATPVNAPTGEAGSGDTTATLGFNPTAGDGLNSRGRFGETDANSDLTIDFGFFIPMSLGNRVFRDDGTGGGVYNNGIMDGGELPIANVRVELYRDANLDGLPDAGLVRFDNTDAGGYYLFDDLASGPYVVVIPASNFNGAAALVGYNTSTPTGTENAGVAGNPYTPNTDRDDNGLNVGTAPTAGGVRSGTIVLAYDSEPSGESELSGQANPGSPANLTFGPTGWDGQFSRGRWDEKETNSNLTVDFGFIPVFALGNRVYFDTDNNSQRNGAEVGVDNVRVQLFASNGVTEIPVGPDGILNTSDDAPNGVLTAGGGYYRFNNLPAGDYVVVIPASNFGTGGTLQGYWSSATTISAAGVVGETPAAPANSDADADDNGTLTSGKVVSSVVSLGPTSTSEPTGETDLSGGQGQPDGQANMTVDFGFYRVEVGNLVYIDNNGNGNYDGAPETGVSGSSVRLFASNGTTEINVGPDGILGTSDDAAGGMLTNSAGLYIFSGLPQGQYVIKTTTLTGTDSTIDTFNAADTTNPDTNADNNDNGIGLSGGPVSSGIVTLTPGSTGSLNQNTVTQATGTTLNPTVDFGFINLVALGNRVWIDDGAGGGIANNGILDGTEPGMDNVTVELYTSAGALVGSTTTAGGGYYQFDLLYPGTYYVLIPAAEFQAGGDLASYFSSAGNGTDATSDEITDENGIDNPAPETNGIRSIDYVLTPGGEVSGEDQSNYSGSLADASVNFTADFGFTQKYSLGNCVWFDTDNSGTINGSEVGIDGVTVNLYIAGNLGTIQATDVTSNGGYYLFDDLYPGDYVVSIAANNFGGVLSGYWSSDTTISTAGILSETMAPDVNATPADRDDNGTLQTGGLLNGAVISSGVTLGPSGDTEPSGETDLESGLAQGHQPDGRANMTVDFGFYTMSLGDLVWSDLDKNGAFNGAETGIDNLTVELWSADGTTQLDTTTTASGGLYQFPNLAQGSYTVRMIAPTGTSSSVDTFAAADTTNPTLNTDNNDNGVGTGSGTVASNAVTLTPGLAQTSNTVDNASGSTFNPSLDFGFTPVFALGNRVWFDTNNNGGIDGGEVGIDGVTVNLYDAAELTTILDTQTTSNGGYYLFNGLPSGDYVVVVAAINFGGILNGYWSSGTSRTTAGALMETSAAPADSDIDLDDNGTRPSSGSLNGAVASSVVTLGPATITEPTSETDLDNENQGQPDAQANMTVDFGFYTIRLGNMVWNDLDNNGRLDGAEAGIDAVTVELRSGDGSTMLGTTTTSGGGIYTFSSLPAGDYIVRLPAVNFNPGGVLRNYRSSTGPLPGGAYEPAPDADTDTTDSDDNGSEANGLLGLGGYIQTLPVTLTPAGEQDFNNATSTTIEFRLDFGVNNSPQIDLSVTKTDHQDSYIDGGTLNYVVTVTNNGPADANGMAVVDALPAQIASWAWTCAVGTPTTYNCTDAASNSADFTDSLDLPQLASVTYNVTAQVASDANGSLTNSVTIAPPSGMTDITPPDNTASDTDLLASLVVTKDDGVDIVAPDFTTTYTITVANNGDTDLTGITLTDTIPAGMSFVSAGGGGTFSSGQIAWPLFDLLVHASTSFTVQLKVVDAAGLGEITSFTNTVHVQDDGSHTTGTPVEARASDTDVLASSNIKTLTNTNQAASSTPNVLVGEILTYSIRLDVPVGTLTDLKVVDVLDHGLAFVGCDATTPISSGSLILGQDPCTTPGAITVQAEPTTDTNPVSADAGRHITFDFGTVQNNGSATQTLSVYYRVVVLNIADNVNGVKGLNNQVEWQWTGGQLSESASGVDIVEPQLVIVKTVDPLVAVIGSVVTYTLEVSHTSASTAPAFDVLVTDGIPAGLTLVPGSIAVNGSSGLPAPTLVSTPTQFTVYWSSFPVSEKATITFQAKFVGPSPVVNTSTVEWSSLQIDPHPHLVPQSSYNRFSTERRYDPLSQTTNDYEASSSAELKTPTLPKTGFAPHIQTMLPAQSLDEQYAATDIIMEIPSLNLRIPVVGVPQKGGSWDVTWLENQAGWLEGTSFPAWNGNSVLTAHVYLANGLPGPFVNLNTLKYGDKIVIHAYGQKYTFEVTSNTVIEPQDMSAFRHEEKPALTLITCKVYDPATGTYLRRVVVRTALVEVTADQ
jgi:LPXTG-site transpeptidase (sortase) family protein